MSGERKTEERVVLFELRNYDVWKRNKWDSYTYNPDFFSLIELYRAINNVLDLPEEEVIVYGDEEPNYGGFTPRYYDIVIERYGPNFIIDITNGVWGAVVVINPRLPWLVEYYCTAKYCEHYRSILEYARDLLRDFLKEHYVENPWLWPMSIYYNDEKKRVEIEVDLTIRFSVYISREEFDRLVDYVERRVGISKAINTFNTKRELWYNTFLFARILSYAMENGKKVTPYLL